MLRRFDFKCVNNHIHEIWVDADEQPTCPDCNEQTTKMLSPPTVSLDPISGSFPGATMKWAKDREKKIQKERKANSQQTLHRLLPQCDYARSFMATFIDKHQDEEENTQEEFTSLDEDVEDVDPNEVIEEPEQANPEPQDDGLPDKYHGKSPEEIAKMHMEAEKLLGRQSSEVGELRRIVDDFVKAQLDTKTAPQHEQEDEVDWYSDPEKAMQNAIEKHPKIKEAEQLSATMRQQTALSQLHERHPDFQQILQDKAFGEWVSKSKIRLQLFKQADAQYDAEAADELLSTWKERQQFTSQAVANEQAERKRQVKSASTGNASGSGEAPSKKIYRRADLINLMQKDPDRYMSMADEITQAYAEKRVR